MGWGRTEDLCAIPISWLMFGKNRKFSCFPILSLYRTVFNVQSFFFAWFDCAIFSYVFFHSPATRDKMVGP